MSLGQNVSDTSHFNTSTQGSAVRIIALPTAAIGAGGFGVPIGAGGFGVRIGAVGVAP